MKEHLPEYFAEFAGTAIMMAIGTGAIVFMWSEGSMMTELIPSEALRRLATGVLFAGGATLVVISRLGQRSGGHLNPAMTLAFWWKGQVAPPDLFAYAGAQIAGALLGVWIVAMVGGAAAESVQWGITLPGAGYSVPEAFLAEAVITFLLVFLVLFCVSNQRFAAATPFLAGALVAFLVWVEAPISGTGLNPARSFAPALVSARFEHHWLYWIAPAVGAIAAVVLFARTVDTAERPGCAKLFHTERYRCIFLQCAYEVFPAGRVVMREGEQAVFAYVIEEGELEVRKRAEDGSERVLSRLGPGEWAGELGMLLRLPRSATVVASRDSRLRMVTEQNFKHVIAEHPTETERLLRQLAKRLHETSAQLVL
ncbi:MAG: aquaporin [Acidobacteria bacterium]|nr:aquaporin [Acidobacteriota bacterium]